MPTPGKKEGPGAGARGGVQKSRFFPLGGLPKLHRKMHFLEGPRARARTPGGPPRTPRGGSRTPLIHPEPVLGGSGPLANKGTRGFRVRSRNKMIELTKTLKRK